MRNAVLIILCSLLVACGGGGGPETGSLQGRLVLEQSPPTPQAELAGESKNRREREPNDHLFSAVDLGDGREPVVLAGSVGSAVDPMDVFRLGPAAGETALTLRFDSGGAELACMPMLETGEPGGALRLKDAGTLVLRLGTGQERMFAVTAPAPCRYRLELVPDQVLAASRPAPMEVTRAAALRQQVLSSTCVPGEVIVCRQPELTPAEVVELGLELVAEGGGVQRLRDPGAAQMPAGAAAELAVANVLRRVRRALPDAVYVSPNLRTPLSALAGTTVVPDDPLFDKQFGLTLAGFPAAWSITTGRDDVAIAVMDTGIRPKHPDLAARLSPLGYDFISDKENAGDGDGVDPDPTEPDDFLSVSWFHGTYITGVLGAVTNNGTGIAGGTWRGAIIPVRVFGKLGGLSSDRVQAFRYLAGLPNVSGRILKPEQRPCVLNLSYATPLQTAAEKTEIENLAKAGVHMVAAVGNDGQVTPPLYPAAWPEVIGVGSVDRALKRAVYSNSASWVEVMAFGGTEIAGPEGILSTWATKIGGKIEYVYNSFAGTSIATPSVSAVVALMEAVHPGMSATTVRRVLEDTSRDLGPPGRDIEYGWGLLQADAAVALAQNLGPSIVLIPPGFALADAEVRSELRVENGAGGSLHGLAVAPVGSGSGAIEVRLEGNAAPTRIVATVDRRGIKVGNYRERFRLTSTTVSAEFDVIFRKPIPDPPPSMELRLWAGSELLVSTATKPDGTFDIRNLPFGSYRLQAGVDRDRNGLLGDPQEWFLERTVEVGPDRTSELNGVVVPWRD